MRITNITAQRRHRSHPSIRPAGLLRVLWGSTYRTPLICAIVLLALLSGALLATGEIRPTLSARQLTYYVSPSGSDDNDGASPAAPLKTIQAAIDRAGPGATINLAAGDYLQDVVSRRAGTRNAPITIRGPANAVLKGAGKARIFEIHHDYLTLEGFTIDGLWASPKAKSGYRDKLLYVVGRQRHDGVTGLKVLRMTFRNAGGECLRLRYFAQRNEVGYSTFTGCGVHDFKFKSKQKNGEAIYIGTAPEQRNNGENPTSDLDESNNNWIHHNTFDTRGNECVDIKEGSSGNMIEYNRCTGQRDPDSGGFDARGGGNIIRYNESYGNAGVGIRLGGDTRKDGLDNQVYGNTLHDNQVGGIKLLRQPQHTLCGNSIAGDPGDRVIGADGPSPDPTAPCP